MNDDKTGKKLGRSDVDGMLGDKGSDNNNGSTSLSSSIYASMENSAAAHPLLRLLLTPLSSTLSLSSSFLFIQSIRRRLRPLHSIPPGIGMDRSALPLEISFFFNKKKKKWSPRALNFFRQHLELMKRIESAVFDV